MKIGREDLFWNYAATFLKIASSALLIPLILRMMPTEMVGIWSVFMTIASLAVLLDFGFNPSFARNVTYIFSGVKSLRVTGFETSLDQHQPVDFDLLKGIIAAMRWFYLRMALILLVLLSTLGTLYLLGLLQNYSGDKQEVFIAWIIFCAINAYNLSTLYYEALLQGKGLIKRSKQIVVVGQAIYLVVAALLILSGYGLIAIILAQSLSTIVIRWLSHRSFFTPEIKKLLALSQSKSEKDVLKIIYPNAFKVGLTSLGGFLVLRSSIIIGALYLSLPELASYGITIQLIFIIAGMASIYTTTYQPRIAQLRVENNVLLIKEIYLKGQMFLVLTYFVCGITVLVAGEWALRLIGSQTQLIPRPALFFALIISFLETNHSTAGSILLSKNEVPFFKAAIVSGCATVLLLILFFQYTELGLWSMILAPGIAQGVYQNWKWPYVVISELKIIPKDFLKFFSLKLKAQNSQSKS